MAPLFVASGSIVAGRRFGAWAVGLRPGKGLSRGIRPAWPRRLKNLSPGELTVGLTYGMVNL